MSDVAEMVVATSGLPEGWRISTLGEVALGKGEYGANVSKAEFDPLLPRYVRITDISDQGHLIPTSLASISHEAAKGYFLQEGDLLFARSGATVGKTLLYQAHYGECAFAGYLIRFRLDPTKIDPYFARNIVQAEDYWDWITTVQRAQAQPNINAQEYATLPLMLPPLDEQRRIAEVLRSVDEAIAAQRATCNQHTQLIDAVFEAWSNQSAPMVALVDLLDLKNGINFEKEERADEGTLTLDVMNMFSNDMTPTYEGAYRISKAVPSDLILQSGDVLFVRSSVKREGVGWTSLADGFDEMTTFCGFIIRGRPKRDDVLSRYVVGVLRAPKYRRWLIQHSTRSALTNINQKTISSAVIPLPSFEHQQGLVEQYDRLAAAAFDCKTALATLEALRTKLTGDLLSGRVRVPA